METGVYVSWIQVVIIEILQKSVLNINTLNKATATVCSLRIKIRVGTESENTRCNRLNGVKI